MDEQLLSDGRFLLYVDILGFKELVKSSDALKVYSHIDSSLREFSRWEQWNREFSTIYYADTLLFYQNKPGYADWAFLDVYAVGGMLLSAMLAQEIPARGSIVFGEFQTKLDSQGKHQVVFGKALVEAHESEGREQWLGIAIQPSAWEPYEQKNPGVISVFENEGVWKRRDDGVLLLNPFVKMRGGYEADLIGELDLPCLEWGEPDFPNGLRGFRFLLDQANAYSARGDFSSRDAVKYHATIAFLKDVMGRELFEWADKTSGVED